MTTSDVLSTNVDKGKRIIRIYTLNKVEAVPNVGVCDDLDVAQRIEKNLWFRAYKYGTV